MASRNRQSTPRKPARSAGKDTLMIVLGLGLVGGFFISAPTVMVLAFGIVPSLVAYVVDPYARKYCTRCVGAFNIAGIMPFLLQVWKAGGNSIADAAVVLANPMAWMVMYGAAAVGWILYIGLPSVVSVYITIIAEQKTRILKNRQAELLAEWGQAVTGIEPKGESAILGIEE